MNCIQPVAYCKQLCECLVLNYHEEPYIEYTPRIRMDNVYAHPIAWFYCNQQTIAALIYYLANNYGDPFSPA